MSLTPHAHRQSQIASLADTATVSFESILSTHGVSFATLCPHRSGHADDLVPHASTVHINATCLPTGAELQAEVAVVGAGPAGITLALELANAGHSVLLIESGGDSYNAGVQRLGETVAGDSVHVPMSLATRRQIGGASNLWGGRCVPFDAIDFQHRKIIGNTHWPVSYAELQSRFARACDWCMCGEPAFDADTIPSLAGKALIPGWPEGEVRSTTLERWSMPTNFGRAYRAQLKASRLATVVSKLTCTEIVCAADGHSVAHLVTRTLAGTQITIRAKRYVLACGGIESTRLLFASNRHHPDGIGNHSGHLGHWYMAHLGASIAQVHFKTPARQTVFGFERDADGIYVRRRFTFAPEYLIAHDLPNVALWLENPEISDPSHRNAVLSFVYLALASPLGRYFIAEGIRRRKIDTLQPVSIRQHLWNVARNIPRATWFALTFGYERFLKRGYKVPGVFVPSASNAYRLYYHGEHLPHYASHIAPTGERDALGVPRVRTRLCFEDEDVHAAIRVHEHFDRYLRRHGIGYLEYLYEDREAGFRQQLLDGYHQAGTTRMSARPEDGVLDAQLAVHGFEDLFVASSSAFVTSGQANSTFMIVAFALRLADHLRQTLRQPPPPPTTTTTTTTTTTVTTPHANGVVRDTAHRVRRAIADREPI
jgi:choline dehydrogenase-like flavoprotein